MEFTYKAKNKEGATQEGMITASNEVAAINELQKKSLFVLSIKAINSKQTSMFKKKITLKDKIIFTKQLAVMIRGGLPLVDAINALKEQTDNKEFSSITNRISVDLSGGMILSKALAKHKKVFPNYYIAVVSSGEKSGKLDVVLESLANQLQKDYDLISKVKSAVSYPIVIVCALLGVMILMLIFVIPKLKNIFSEMGVQLPLPTRVLLAVSDFMVIYWYICIILVIGMYFLIRYWAKTQKGGLMIDTFKIKVPIFGELVKKVYLARFTRTTGTLTASGLPMLEVIATDKEVVANRYFAPIFDSISKDIENGVAFSQAIKKHRIFPVMISQMVSVGEKSGKIDEILFQLADFFDKEVETSTAGMASMIEPILIIIIGAGIGLAIASVIMPIYSLVNVI